MHRTKYKGKQRYLCLESQNNVFYDEDKTFGKGMHIILLYKVRSYRKLKEGLLYSIQKSDKEFRTSYILI